MRSLFRFSAPCVGLLLSAGLLYGQSFLGSITGIVKDTSGAVIPQAQVTLVNIHTGLKGSAKTNAAGVYLFGDLEPGVYAITVSHIGFKKVTSGNITLIASESTRFDATLAVGTTKQTVQVQATPPALDTENGRLSNTLTRTELLDLPLNNRNSLDFMMLQSSDYQDNEGIYSIGGDRSVFNNFTIDAVSANSAAFGGQVGPMTQESFDAVSDMKMDTSNNSAAYPDMGTLMIQDRSGTNQFHGSLFDYENNWAFNARPFFAGSIPRGPIEHDPNNPIRDGIRASSYSMSNYWVIAWMHIQATIQAMDFAGTFTGFNDHWRFVGNDLTCPNGSAEMPRGYNSDYGYEGFGCVISTYLTNSAFLGNDVHNTGTNCAAGLTINGATETTPASCATPFIFALNQITLTSAGTLLFRAAVDVVRCSFTRPAAMTNTT
jgi:hypothetical protein